MLASMRGHIGVGERSHCHLWEVKIDSWRPSGKINMKNCTIGIFYAILLDPPFKGPQKSEL